MIVLLIALTLLLFYVYLGYPLLLAGFASLFRRSHKVDETLVPSVALVISAYNEEQVIGAKLDNALQLDYPAEKLSIVVVSDASSDATDNIVRGYADRGVVLVRAEERRGKTAGLNLALEKITSDIVVFSDANAIYEPTALLKLVRHFADEGVGYVVGHARYENTDTAAGSSEGAYWNFEILLKQWESDFDSVVGGDGAIYAIRRNLWEPLQVTDINDFINPLQIVAKGFRGIFDPQAICTERPAGEFQKEFGRKVRISNRSFNGLLRVPAVCNPLRVGRFSALVISHKLLRWLSPYFFGFHFFVLLFCPVTSRINGISILVALYLMFSLLALGGWWQERNGRGKAFFYFPYYFVLMNIASAVGVFLRLRGKTISTWETVREKRAAQRQGRDLAFWALIMVIFLSGGKILLAAGLVSMFLQGVAYLLIAISIYTYVGYPLLLTLLAKWRSVAVDYCEDYLPTVTLLIAAFNEEQEIGPKLENSLALDYPQDRLRILVASDGSTDKTNEIVGGYHSRGVELLAYPENRGKISVLNDAMECVSSDIVVFSDANVSYDPLAVRKLVRNFNDPRVGAVSGKVILLNAELSYGKSEQSYYAIEHFIQEKEGLTGTLIGADGAMYAIRRQLFRPPAPDTILDDFAISMDIALAGHLVVFEKAAIGHERNLKEIKVEFRRKARIIAGGFQYLLRGAGFPADGFLQFKFFSHKVLRWFSGPIAIVLLAILIGLQVAKQGDPVLTMALGCQAGLLVLAMMAHASSRLRKFRVMNRLHYLFTLKLASLVGFWLGVTGRQKVTWRR